MHTFGSLLLALQVQGEVTPLAGSGEVVNLIAETTPLNQAVLALLLLFSVASWAIILQKTLGVPRIGPRHGSFPRRVSPEQQVF